MEFKRVQFTNELTEKAMYVYSNSSFCFYTNKGTYYYSDVEGSQKMELGTLDDVIEFLEMFYC